MNGPAVIFVGRVVVDGGERFESEPARLAVEEPIQNVPQDRSELEVYRDAGTSCNSSLAVGERYVIFATTKPGPRPRLITGGCSNTFNVQGNEHILDALRNAARGGSPRLVGRVREDRAPYSAGSQVGGARVIAESDVLRREVLTDIFGRYEFLGLTPGRYSLDVSKPGFVPNVEYNRRRPGPVGETSITRVRSSDAGTVLVREGSFEVRDLSMWPNGRISGTVRGSGGKTLSNVTVEPFAIDDRGTRSVLFREAQSRPDGGYTIGPLPGGDYIVGVSASHLPGRDPYSESFYAGGLPSGSPTTIRVADGEETTGVDLILPPKRIRTTLRVTVIGLDGRPHSGAGVTLQRKVGNKLWLSINKTNGDGLLAVPVYVGDNYVVRASAPPFDCVEGSTPVYIGSEDPSVVILAVRRPRPDQ